MDYFNSDIIERHEQTTKLNAWMVEHFNFILSMSFLSDDQIEMYHDEKAMYLCYDV
jgi:hypothetical protein